MTLIGWFLSVILAFDQVSLVRMLLSYFLFCRPENILAVWSGSFELSREWGATRMHQIEEFSIDTVISN